MKRGGLILAAFLLVMQGIPAAQQPAPTFEEIVTNLTATNDSLLSFQVEQLIDVRILFFRYRLVSTVYAARPARYRVVVHNPPWFLRSLGNVFVHVGRPEDVLKSFAPKAIAWTGANGQRRISLSLTRRREEVIPPEVEAVVDPERWVVEKMILHYDWGSVLADYQYGIVEGYVLPVAINFRVSNYLIRATITYRNYQLNVPISDETFESRN